jgi:hypothetical protein
MRISEAFGAQRYYGILLTLLTRALGLAQVGFQCGPLQPLMDLEALFSKGFSLKSECNQELVVFRDLRLDDRQPPQPQ